MYTPKRNTDDGAGIYTPHSAGTPQTPRINDDAAERRRRRKSAIERRRSTMVTTPHRRQSKAPLFSQSPQPPAQAQFSVLLPTLTPEELNQRYEEWMKIAADNKINANNTWDFALIDYFYDMSLLRDGDSINFQKASCTLDGCVKIYSSRVDSVATETGRLLSGLAEAPGNKRGKGGRTQDEDGEEGDEGDGSGSKPKSRRAARSVATLAKDFASISVKKLDLEFSVDPLFKKTSADFDEGGASGLLLNHLSFDADGKIVFDASDSNTIAEEIHDEQEEEEEEAVEETNGASAKKGTYHPTLVDMSSITSMFDNIAQHLEEAHICPSLADFGFTRDTSLDFSLLKEHFRDGEEKDGGVSFSNDMSVDGQSMDDVFNTNNDWDAGDDMGHFLDFDEADAGPIPLDTAATMQMTEAEEAQENGEGNLSLQFTSSHLAIAEDEDNLLSYFDTKLTKGWAGPEHWRLPISRALVLNQQQQQQQAGEDCGNGEDGDTATKRKRSEKQFYFTDFMDGEDVSAETLFARPQRASAIAMSRKASQNQNHTLPEDVHFSSKNLFNLLLKPRLKFNPRHSRRVGGADASTDNAAYGGFVVDGDDGAGGNIFSGNDNNDYFDDDFGDQIRFDDGDDYDDSTNGVNISDEMVNDNKSDIPQLKLIKPLYVNYARRATRVNIKKLKDNIWREMAAAGGGDNRRDSTTMDTDGSSGKDAAEVQLATNQKFSDIVGGLKDMYPQEQLKELSISYCFICLLHLANERNLRITSDSDLRDLVVTQDHFE